MCCLIRPGIEGGENELHQPRVLPTPVHKLLMMKRCLFPLFLALSSVPTWAVYAPIPEEELGQAFTVGLGGGIYHDSNIFGGATGEISSMVYRMSPSLSFNSSVTPQTFVSASYNFNFDQVEDRPLNKSLTSHFLRGRIAHSIHERSTIDFNASYSAVENPESLLAGVPLNTDQSFNSSQVDFTYTGTLSQRTGFTFKGRNSTFAYDLTNLANQLDRNEFLIGLSADYAYAEATKILGEYRFQDVAYDSGGASKDKNSNYFLVGFDHAPSEKMSFSFRAGMETRSRSGAPDDDAPYAEITGSYEYGKGSFLSAGYIRTIEENSNVDIYTDVEVNRFFVNLQHAITPQVFGSMLYNIEPSVLKGRATVSPDRDEVTQRVGFALTYRPARHWLVAGTIDLDITDSDDNNRDLERERIGVDVRYTF